MACLLRCCHVITDRSVSSQGLRAAAAADIWCKTLVAGAALGPMFADASTVKVLHGADHDTL